MRTPIVRSVSTDGNSPSPADPMSSPTAADVPPTADVKKMGTLEMSKTFDPEKLVGDDLATYKEMVDDIAIEPVILFMKGTPGAPKCQHSRRMLETIKPFNYEFLSYDVLHEPVIRDGVKHVSKWPTIPQLFIGGKFVGGVDVVAELVAANQLESVFVAASAVKMKPAETKGDAAEVVNSDGSTTSAEVKPQPAQ